jgi:glucose-1-phosphate cytidylyltransferase
MRVKAVILASGMGSRLSDEQEPLMSLARDRQMAGDQHDGFWRPTDAMRDRAQLKALRAAGAPTWKHWE